MTQPADEGFLIQEANRQRQWQRAGKLMKWPVIVVLVFLVVGGLLLFGDRLVPVLHYVAIVVGFIALWIACMSVLWAISISPLAQWGVAAHGSCPWCGRHGLREHDTMRFAPKGSGEYPLRGTVTLCTPDCGYAAAQDIKVRVDGVWYLSAAEDNAENTENNAENN
jgi:hypothetical protein